MALICLGPLRTRRSGPLSRATASVKSKPKSENPVEPCSDQATVTVTALEVVVFPALSWAIAVSLC
jgi:hypothetical protein